MITLTKSDLDMVKRGIIPPYLSKFSTQELLQTFANKVFEQQALFDEAGYHLMRAKKYINYLTNNLIGGTLTDAQVVEDELGALESIINEGVLE